MQNANIVIMGKTGAGKSTLVNAVMDREVALTGTGGAVTRENKVYSRSIMLSIGQNGQSNRTVSRKLNLYDTVGLEVENKITRRTLEELKKLLQKARNSTGTQDINLVWFCVNSKSRRFEPYEIELIRMLSYEYEIPFVIVITRCEGEEKGELERQIQKDMPEITVMRVLAKDFSFRGGMVIRAFGVQELLRRSVFEHHNYKVRVLTSKLNTLSQKRERRIDEMIKEAERCIEKHSKSAQNIGFVPGVCIPAVNGICIKMVNDLMDIFGIKTADGFGADIFANVLTGLITAPFMCIPLLSAGVSYAYVQSAGEEYLDTLKSVIERSTDEELKNTEIMSKRIREELSRKK